MASAKVSSIAALAVLSVIKPQARSANPTVVANSAARLISGGADAVARVAVVAAHRARSAAQSTARPILSRQRVAADLKSVATATSDFARSYAMKEALNRIEFAAPGGPHSEEVVAALTAAAADVVRAITSVVEEYIATITPTTVSVPSVEKLALAAADAATKASRAVASTVAFINTPPPYGDLELGEGETSSPPLLEDRCL